MLWKYLAVAAVSYVIGSFAPSIWLSRAKLGGDIRAQGSGNAGATNMARVFGWGAGLITFGADALKAVVCMIGGHMLLGDIGLALAGMACILGHCYPALHHFKGGKGVSVGGAIACGIDWRVGVAVIGTFLIVALLSKKVSLGSICGALAITIASVLLGVGTPKLVLAVFSMSLVIFRHSANIRRLIDGTEPDFKAKKKKTD